jgi:two-component system sensor histidine kinase PilS (NtrC family)
VSAAATPIYPDSFWRSLRHLNGFRLYLGVFFVFSALFADRLTWLSRDHLPGFLMVSLVYAGSTWLFRRGLLARRPSFERQLLIQLCLDIAVVFLLMQLGGGRDTGLGLLLLVFMAAAGLHARTRVMLLMPALATLTLLVSQGWEIWHGGGPSQEFFRAGLLAVGYFMVSSLSHVMARGALAAAELAGAKQREAANLEKINARVIQDLPYGVVIVDGDGHILSFNGRAQTWLGCREGQHGELAACSTELASLLGGWTGGAETRARVVKGPNGGYYRARILELDAERSQGAVIVLEDMSELEREAQKLKLAALGRLTANLAHEIRNPLSAVNHAAQLLAEDTPAASPASRLTRIIEDNVMRLNRMVEDVLSLNRRDRLQREAIDLDSFLTDFLGQFRGAEHVAEEVIETRIEPGLAVLADRTHLHQIMWNLMRNAWRHCSKRHASIRLGAARHGERVILEVYNDGTPIPPDLLARLFEPFYTTDSRGTGLGLHIARELADANGAELGCVGIQDGALFKLNCEIPVPAES